ncbi:uncharacterized protein LTR77_009611 [Saxophila tyrrhenica]|uniref:Amidoligase enzyme n=1 Tax=Saxophila tyrrhenica TaxID=1690608 RepID=A0AAV9NY42_9PEZI|nr:hypothetical protein LTR77_009611 [Saxophila tyrrhenica]
MTAPDITFGVELEFIALYKLAGDEEPSGTLVGETIYNRLLAAGIPAVGYESLDGDINDTAPSYSRWRVETDDVDLKPDERKLLPEGWYEEPIELVSRKLHINDPNCINEIATVLQALRSIEGVDCRFVTNVQAGLHVHMGWNDEKIPLRVAKNVLQLCTAFERQLDQIHSTDRINNRSCRALSLFHMKQIDGDEDGNENRESKKKDNFLLSNLYDIETLDSYKAIVNFDNLWWNWKEVDENAPITGTIEFRQHAGSLDLAAIRNCIALTSTIVHYSASTPPLHFVQLLLKGLDTTFTLRQLLQCLGCHEDLITYYSSLPRPRSTSNPPPRCPEISTLLAHLDASHQKHRDPTAIAELIAEKVEVWQYGVLPEGDVLIELENFDLRAHLVGALKDTPAYLSNGGQATDKAVDEAREEALRVLARCYTVDAYAVGREGTLGDLREWDGRRSRS